MLLTNIVTKLYKCWVKCLTTIAKIKVFKTPGFIIYDPSEYDYNIRGHHIKEIETVIKPGDIVMRGYDHYVDGFMIPGLFSHSGIYVGDDKIIHAISTGVQTVDLIDFFQADRGCVLRVDSEASQAVIYAKHYLGKGYDFKFDTLDSDEFYCHELTAKCYSGIDIKSVPVTFLGKEFKCLGTKYLAESFLDNKHITEVITINPTT